MESNNMEGGDMCGICYDDLSTNDTIALEECGHKFDKDCMAEYVKESNHQFERTYHETEDEDRPQLETRVPCPLCRTPLDDEQFEKIQK